MTAWLAAALFCARPSPAAVVEAVPSLSAAPLGAAAASAAVPLSAPALSAAPALAAPLAPLAAAPVAAPSVLASPAAAPALAAAPAASKPEPSARPSAEAESAAGRRVFDGGAASGDAAAVPAGEADPTRGRAAAPGPGWSLASFEGQARTPIFFKRRAGAPGGPVRVYAGGLALNESYEPLFADQSAPKATQYFVWTRGHVPSGGKSTSSPLDADARDLARMIVLAARETGAPKVELALHSFGTLVFQRLLQLRREPEARAALKLLAGSRVVLLHATTHYAGSERRAGREFEQMGQATKAFVDWLDSGDSVVDMWRRSAELNPLLWAQAQAVIASWQVAREQAIAMASQQAAGMMRKDLSAPWAPAIDPIRQAFQKDLAKDTGDPAWQEALLRRSSGMFRLEMTKRDAAFLRRLKTRVDFVHAAGDQLLNWESARILFELYGVETPKDAPPAGTVLTDKTGRLRARIVDGDHYFPLKQPERLAEILDP